jgi:surface antigen
MHIGPAARQGWWFAGLTRRTALHLAVIAAALCGLAFASAPLARADESMLCGGYGGCSAGSFSTHDYQYAADESWWAMYPGNNCTNYAAYVESQVFGVARPSLLLGDADQWGLRASEAGVPVDATPTVGSVAVWGSDAPGMGGYGHVAVVEAVAPDGSYIDVSQSGMGSADDGYDWERVYRDGGSWESWPGSFIHFSGPGIPGTLPRAGMRVAGAELVMPGAA